MPMPDFTAFSMIVLRRAATAKYFVQAPSIMYYEAPRRLDSQADITQGMPPSVLIRSAEASKLNHHPRR